MKRNINIKNLVISLTEIKISDYKYGNLLVALFALYFANKFIYVAFPILSVLSWDIGFVDSSSPFCESLIDLYYVVWYVLVIVLVGVIYILVKMIAMFTWNVNFINNDIMDRLYRYHQQKFLRVFFIFYEMYKRTNMIPFISSINLKDSGKNILNFWYNRKKKKFLDVQSVSEYRTLEAAWCITPSIALMSIGNPTFGLIFSLDSTLDPAVTLQVIGHQWYWSYNYEVTLHVPYDSELYQYTDKARFYQAWKEKFNPDYTGDELIAYFIGIHENKRPTANDYNELLNGLMKLKSVVHYTISFDSTMIAVEDLNIGENRLYQVSDEVVLPVGVPIKVLITSADVLHSWSIPNLGLKVDAVPGRINQFITEIKTPGKYFGQCSELCGTMHGFMPIVLKVVTLNEFEKWVMEKGTIN